MTYAFCTRKIENGWICQVYRLHNKFGSLLWFTAESTQNNKNFTSEHEAIACAADWLTSYLQQASNNIDNEEFC